MKKRIGILAALFLLSQVSSVAAQGAATVKVTGFDAGNFPRVRAFVSVTDSSGNPFESLPREAFKLAEDERDAEIVAINASQEPIHVGLLIDHSGSMGQPINKLTDAQAAASAFVDAMRTQDEAFVTMFDDNTTPLQDFTSDHNALNQAVTQINVGGGTAFYDAAYNSALKFESRKSERKIALIAMTDGLDNREELLAQWMGAGSKHTLDEAINEAKTLNVVIYTIGLGGDADQSRLQRMASETGGRFYFAPSSDQLKGLYQLIAAQLQKEYAIDFNSPRAYADGTQRRVKVSVALPDGTSQTAEGVYVAGFLFNRIHADWMIGALLGLLLLVMGTAPGIFRMLLKPHAAPQASAPPAAMTPMDYPPPALVGGARCLYCGQPVRSNARFCGSCGRTLLPQSAPPSASVSAPQMVSCPRCTNPLRPGAKFCAKCGYRMP